MRDVKHVKMKKDVNSEQNLKPLKSKVILWNIEIIFLNTCDLAYLFEIVDFEYVFIVPNRIFAPVVPFVYFFLSHNLDKLYELLERVVLINFIFYFVIIKWFVFVTIAWKVSCNSFIQMKAPFDLNSYVVGRCSWVKKYPPEPWPLPRFLEVQCL